MNRRHHAFVIEAEAEKGIKIAQTWAEKELGMKVEGNPDVIALRCGLFSVDDARRVTELAAQAPFRGEYKVLIIAASRAYHEAQNALLKLFEEPSLGTYLFFILPTLGGLLPTLRSRVQALSPRVGFTKSNISKSTEQFLKASREKRSSLIKKLANGKDEEERRELRDEAITLLNGIEAAAYDVGFTKSNARTLFKDIQVLRGYLHDRSAPVRMILEHLSLMAPKDLL